jgi:uncharacterized protein (DUF1800 family)
MIDRRRILKASAALGMAGPLPSSFAAAPGRDGLSAEQAAAHVLNRLGFGPRPGDIAAVARDPQAWIERQLAPQSLPLPTTLLARLDETRLATGDSATDARQYVQLQRETQLARKNGQAAAEPDEPARQATSLGQFVRGLQRPAIESRLFRALESPSQLEEVMVDFWFNHFNVFQYKSYERVMVGHYEHQAIRPHALGRFRDLLGATAHHPAMLYYLDNWTSVGPQGQSRGRGLNENYARELMELHTLGVDGGYTQRDVTELARMLTGWTFVPPQAGPFAAGAVPERHGFWFNARVHDNGDKEWMGQRIAPRGQAEGEFALDVLAHHPATARHIAFKLAQYFVGDAPPRALVDRLAATLRLNDGQIVPVLRALFASSEFWDVSHVGAKFKTPYHYALSTLRAGGWDVAGALPLAGHLARQGMPLFGCQTPDGYKNTEAAWLSADGMSKRLDFATQVARGRLGQEPLAGGLDADELMQQLGPLVTPATRALVEQRRAEPMVAVAMVLAGPGMMRR